MDALRTTSPSRNPRMVMRSRRRTRENGVNTIKSIGTTPKNVTPSSHWWHNTEECHSKLPKGGGLIQVDIGGQPPVPNSSWLILTFFSSTHFSIMVTSLCNCGLCNFMVVLNPYTKSRQILVVAHLFQLAYFGIFNVITSFCTSKVVLGP